MLQTILSPLALLSQLVCKNKIQSIAHCMFGFDEVISALYNFIGTGNPGLSHKLKANKTDMMFGVSVAASKPNKGDSPILVGCLTLLFPN